jgi:P2 family phage contractile tail tube protein
MAEKIKINRLTNANVYVDGKSFLGKAEEISLPDIKHIMTEHKALGMIAKMEFFSGIDKLEAKIKWNSFYPDALKKMANPTRALQIQVRGSLEEYTSQGRTAETPVVIFITGLPKNFPMGVFKQHDNVESESQLTITYCRMEINREPIAEIDTLANIYKVDGEDIFATYRQNIGA